jgi:hypothetical protein
MVINVIINVNYSIFDEICLGKWTVDYKAQLLNMIDTGIIKTFTESHTIDSVLFNVTCPSVKFHDGI